MRLSDLQNKDIVTLNGKVVGRIIDIIIDNKGTIQKLVVEKHKFRIFNNSETLILWSNIIVTGDDVILVKI